MTDIISKFFLEFSNQTLIIPIVVLGFIWSNRNIFYHTICLTLLSMILSAALKLTFQKLSPYGFSFPSGHMQASVVLYGWLAYNFKNIIFRVTITILLSGIAFGLIYLDYHDLEDILGGVFFAILLIYTYQNLLKSLRRDIYIFSMFLATCMMLYIFIRYDQIPPHVYLAYYALIGFNLSIKIFEQKMALNSYTHKILSSILCFISIYIIFSIFKSSLLMDFPIYLYQTQWLLIGTSIPCGNFTSRVIIEITSNKH